MSRSHPSPPADLATALALLESSQAAGISAKFTLPENRFHAVRARDRAARRGVRRLIRPDNAACVLPHLPVAPLDRTHAILRGDFVLCDLIPTIIAARAACTHLRVSTLGMSAANARALRDLLTAGRIGAITIIVSNYFEQVDKTTTFREVAGILRGHARLAVGRTHAKVICLPIENGDRFIIEGSANLRSSDNIEQVAIFNDPATHDFHSSWIDQLASDPSAIVTADDPSAPIEKGASP